jgi:hypothetical protein
MSNSGTAHPLGDTFAVFGQPLTGHSTGELFLAGIVVGVVGMLGLSMLLGSFNRRLASRGSRRELSGSRREAAGLRLDRERLTQQLDDERTERPRVAVADQPHIEVNDSTPADVRTVAPEPERSGIWHRIGNRAGH